MLPQEAYYPEVPVSLGELFAAEGIQLLGVAAADTNALEQARYEQWLRNGYHGGSAEITGTFDSGRGLPPLWP